MKAKRFEDLEIWQEARCLVTNVYKLALNQRFQKDFGLRDQIQRAAVSVMNNIAEGFERSSNAEFIRFLLISKGSAGEVRSLTYVAADLNYISEEEFKSLYDASIKIIKRISRLVTYLKENKNKPL